MNQQTVQSSRSEENTDFFQRKQLFNTKPLHIKKSLLLLTIAGNVFLSPVNGADGISKLWDEYVQQKKAGQVTMLPDFSYAGYHRGEKDISPQGKIFKVTDYGAIPNDDGDDLYSIHKAISAAKANGGGIVYLPAGKYLINTSMEKRRRLVIDFSNITIRGAGAHAGGTIIHMIHPFGGGRPLKSSRLHIGQTLFLVNSNHSKISVNKQKVLCKVTSESSRQSFSITVDNTQKLNVGDYVLLYAKSKALFEALIKPYNVDPKWKSITSNNACAIEIHQIKAITGSKVIFYQPLVYDIEQKYSWELREHQPIEEVGFEDICFMGNANQRYVHHRSSIDNSGWSMIKMKGVANGFIRRCTFINCSQATYVTLSSNISMLNLLIAGNEAHHGVRAVYFNYGTFGGYIIDSAGCTHGPSVSAGTVSTVYYRSSSPGGIDCHSGRPIASLFDNVSGGRIRSSGGLRDFPQHMRGLVLWNCRNEDEEIFTYDFWQTTLNNVFVKPIIVGFHGQKANFVTKTVGILESNGKPVKPESLYEAQVSLRIGQLPSWLEQAKKDQVIMLSKKLPDYYDLKNPNCKYDLYIETFKVDNLLSFLCSLSFEFNTKLYSYSLNNRKLILKTDQGFLRNALYCLMYCIYKKNEPNNTIKAEAVINNNKNFVCFTIKSPKLNNARYSFDNDIDFINAKAFAKVIGATVKNVKHNNYYEFKLLMPVNN